MANSHFEDRSFERYNMELSCGDEKTIAKAISDNRHLYIGPADKGKNRHFSYVKINHIPLKVLYWRKKHNSKEKIQVITAYPFDVEEYNALLEKHEQARELKYIDFLKSRGYIVYKRRGKKDGN